MKSMKKMIMAAALSAAVLPGLAAGPAQAAPVTFDFTTEPYPGSSNGVITLSGNAFFPAKFTGEFGREIEILTFFSGGSVGGYGLDTFGSGPPVFGNTFLFGQRAFYYFGNTGGPLVEYRFGSEVEILSATFVLYNPSQNLEISFRNGGTSARTEQFFLDTDGYDDLANNPPAVPPEVTLTFDNTFPLVDQITMRSFGQTGAALKTLVIDDPLVMAPIPLPASLPLILTPLLVLGSVAARRRCIRKAG